MFRLHLDELWAISEDALVDDAFDDVGVQEALQVVVQADQLHGSDREIKGIICKPFVNTCL